MPTKNVMTTIGKNTQIRISESNNNSAIFRYPNNIDWITVYIFLGLAEVP